MYTEPDTPTETSQAITTKAAKMMPTRMMTTTKVAMVEELDARNSEGETPAPSMNESNPFPSLFPVVLLAGGTINGFRVLLSKAVIDFVNNFLHPTHGDPTSLRP